MHRAVETNTHAADTHSSGTICPLTPKGSYTTRCVCRTRRRSHKQGRFLCTLNPKNHRGTLWKEDSYFYQFHHIKTSVWLLWILKSPSALTVLTALSCRPRGTLASSRHFVTWGACAVAGMDAASSKPPHWTV